MPAVKFLLIGDGTHKPQLDAEVERHQSRRSGAPGRPRAAGRRRAAAEGVRHLRVAAQQPHGGQQVLRIADQDVRIHGDGRRDRRQRSRADRRGAVAGAAAGRSARGRTSRSTNQRSVLCTPGDVDEFVAAVVGLARRPEVAGALGRNARQAVADHYSWHRHVDATVDVRGRAAARQRRAGGRDRRRLQRTGPEPVEQQPGRLRDRAQRRSRTRSSGSRKSSGIATATTRRGCREVMEFAEHAGEQVLEVGGGMGTDLAQFARNGAHRHRRRSVGRAPAARAGELPAARPDRPVRAPRRRDAAVRRQHLRSRLLERRAAPHAEHHARRRRDPPRAQARRPGDRDDVRGELAAVLAEPGLVLRHEERRPARAARWPTSCRAASSAPATTRGRW